jgi:transposase-like protein
MMSSVIPARLEFSCGHAALVSLPRLKGESAAQRAVRVSGEKAAARGRACDFCGPREQAVVEVRPVQEAVASAELNGHHAPEVKENVMHTTETPSVTRLGADETRRSFPPRRRLNDEQEREVARLYAETELSVPDISKQFSIGESSVYRIAQRRGAGVRRGKSAAAQPAMAVPTAPATITAAPRRGRPRGSAAKPTPPANGRRTRAVVRRVAAPRTPAAKPTRVPRRRATPVAAGASAMQRFQIQFRVETVVQAADIRAAMRQLESLGATDIVAIVRTD